ncbi:MAG: 2-hydroxyacid dehydrogenase [Clostridia bacterium]|nr:2-hydroxyacid dehydrogenase [Clostridia bacterium]
MKNILFYDAKDYEKPWFDKYNQGAYSFDYIESKLDKRTVALAKGYDGICIFVNDEANAAVVQKLKSYGIGLIALRCSGYNNVDVAEAQKCGIAVERVAAYSPHSVAEHAMALLLTLNRKIHKAYIRTRDFNFSLNHLIGFDLHGKTAGVIGTGKIGKTFVKICQGFGMDTLCYDIAPDESGALKYVDLDTLFAQSDVISLHCPLTKDTYHVIDQSALLKMKKGCVLINTSRGALIDSEALLNSLLSGRLGGACLDVYEEEAMLFYEDNSATGVQDELLSLIVSRPNVIVTSHQAYLTHEALDDIARITLQNFDGFFAKKGKMS